MSSLRGLAAVGWEQGERRTSVLEASNMMAQSVEVGANERYDARKSGMNGVTIVAKYKILKENEDN